MPLTSTTKSQLLPYLALVVVCIVWGTTYLAIRIGVTDIPPFLFSALRQIAAGLLLSLFMITLGKQAFPKKENILHQAIAGFFMISMGNGLVSYAEVHVSSGIAAILGSMLPIWVILINMAVSGDERPTFPILLGLAIGLSGIVLIFGENLAEFTNPAYTWGLISIFAANLGWAGGSIYLKRKNQNTNAFLNAGLQMLFGGIFLLPASAAFDDFNTLVWSENAVYALLYLIVFGSILAYACYSYAIKKLPMTIVSLYAYINPLVAVLLGSLLLNEKFNLRIAFAMMITIAGIYIVNRGYQIRNLWKAQFTR
jgi:drug/metabolite transporter (DMT)-like permease